MVAEIIPLAIFNLVVSNNFVKNELIDAKKINFFSGHLGDQLMICIISLKMLLIVILDN